MRGRISFALVLVVAAVACQEPTATARHMRIAFSPALDTAIDIAAAYQDRVIDVAADTVIPRVNYFVTSSDTSVVVNDNNTSAIRGRGAGTATVRATLKSDGASTAEMAVTVRPSRVFIVGFPARPLEVGEPLHFTATHTGSPNNAVRITSSDPSVLSVQKSPFPYIVGLDALRPGRTTLTVVAELDTTIRRTYDVTVVAPAVAKILLNRSSLRLRGRFSVDSFSVSLLSSFGGTVRDRLPSLTSDHPEVAGVVAASTPGFYRVQGSHIGTTNIVVQSGGASASIPATVTLAGPDSANAYPGGIAVPVVTGNDADAYSPSVRVDPEVIGFAIAPKHGTVVKANDFGALTYTASADFVGVDTIGYLVRDLVSGVIDTGIVRINVRPGPFVITQLGNPGAYVTVAELNNGGQVAATITFADSTRRAARWEKGQYTFPAQWDPKLGIHVT